MTEEMKTEEKRKTDELSFFDELRSLYFSMLSIPLNQTDYMEDEYELASWRRVLLTLFIGSLAMVIITQLVRIGVFVALDILPQMILTSELSNRLWDFGIGFVSTLILVLVTGYVARLWFFRTEEDEAAYPLVSYVQIIVIVKALQVIFALPFLETSSMLSISSIGTRSLVNPIVLLILTVIGVVIAGYLYYILSRALQLRTDLRGRSFWLRFLLVVVWYEGLAYVLTIWIAPIVLSPLYRLFF